MKAVGARLPRYDGIAHVTGRTKYVADQSAQGMLACKGLRSPHHSARILSIDTSKAEAHPGVFAVATYKDMPEEHRRPSRGARRPGRRAVPRRAARCATRAS